MLIARQVGAHSGAVGVDHIARQVEPTVGQWEQTTGRSGADSKASGSHSGAVGADHRAIGC